MNTHVTVAIPYFRCRAWLRRAVESILGQSHRDLRLVVMNDADPESPWPLLEDIRDPRLLRFDLAENRGRYFADAVAVQATDSPYYLTQDADDWSEPDRLRILLRALRAGHADFAASSVAHYQLEQGAPVAAKVENFREQLARPLGQQFLYRVPHYALFRVDALRAIGGYYGGYRFDYDRLLMNLLLMTGRLAYVEKPLYARLLRPDSLFTSPETGHESPRRRQVRAELNTRYLEALRRREAYVAGEITAEQLREELARICTGALAEEERNALAAESARLRAIMQAPGGEPSARATMNSRGESSNHG